MKKIKQGIIEIQNKAHFPQKTLPFLENSRKVSTEWWRTGFKQQETSSPKYWWWHQTWHNKIHIKLATLIARGCWGPWGNPSMSLSSALLEPAIAYLWCDVGPGSPQSQQVLLLQEGCPAAHGTLCPSSRHEELGASAPGHTVASGWTGAQ